MEVVDVITQLRGFSKLDFQGKEDMIKNGRPTPELNDLLQRTGQKITRSFQSEWYNRKIGYVDVLQETAFSVIRVSCLQLVRMCGLALAWDFVTLKIYLEASRDTNARLLTFKAKLL